MHPNGRAAVAVAGRVHRFGLPLMLVLVLAALLATPLAPAAAGPRTIVYGRDRAEMVLIPAGPFWMGSAHGDEDEAPLGRVDLPAFYIDRHEVTNAQFLEFLNALPRQRRKMTAVWLGQKRTTDVVVGPDDRYHVPPGLERHPVRHVSWFGAMAYARWAGKELPTEAQWEKAARGVDGRTWPWGEDPDPGACVWGGAGKAALGPAGRAPRDRSPWGCLDMAGNAAELVLGPLDADGAPSARVAGGGWASRHLALTRAAYAQDGLAADAGHEAVGVRLVADALPPALEAP